MCLIREGVSRGRDPLSHSGCSLGARSRGPSCAHVTVAQPRALTTVGMFQHSLVLGATCLHPLSHDKRKLGKVCYEEETG